MKFLLLTLLFLTAPLIASDQVTLEWDGDINSDGYAIFYRDYTQAYVYTSPLCETLLETCTVTVPSDRHTAFVARAWKFGPFDLEGNRSILWSLNSNEVVHIPTVTPPQPPQNLIIRILQALLGWFKGLFA